MADSRHRTIQKVEGEVDVGVPAEVVIIADVMNVIRLIPRG
jgi:hypothetical protein